MKRRVLVKLLEDAGWKKREGMGMLAVYTAILRVDKEDGLVYASVPDLSSCVTYGKDIREALFMVEDALNGCLASMEDHGLEIPVPTPAESVNVPEGSVSTLISVDTKAHRLKYDQRAVRRNVSLPQWMVSKVEQLGINCSQVLQEALKERFAMS